MSRAGSTGPEPALPPLPALVEETNKELRRLARHLRRRTARLLELRRQLRQHIPSRSFYRALRTGKYTVPVELICTIETETHDRVAPLIAYLEASSRATDTEPSPDAEPAERILAQLHGKP